MQELPQAALGGALVPSAGLGVPPSPRAYARPATLVRTSCPRSGAGRDARHCTRDECSTQRALRALRRIVAAIVCKIFLLPRMTPPPLYSRREALGRLSSGFGLMALS